MSRRPSLRAGLALLALVTVSACSTKVERLDESKAVDLSGGWNDTDSRLVSQEMIQDSLSRPWLQEFRGRSGQSRPAVIVGEVRNLSHEHINVNTFTLDLERALINSGKVDFVAAKDERKGFRMVEVAEGRIVFEAEPLPAFYNGRGSVHGGFTAALLDTALGCVVNTTMGPGRAYATVDLKVTLVRPLHREVGTIRCIGTAIQCGARLATSEARIVDARDKIYAHGTATCMAVDSPGAQAG